MIDSELISLVSLFDDTDEPVITAVNDRMMERGVSVLEDLSQMLLLERSPLTKNQIMERIDYLTSEFTLDRLAKEASFEYSDLMNGIFLISKIVTTSLERERFDTLIFTLVEDMVKEITGELTAMEKVRIFNHIFYQRLLFKCRNYPATRESTSLVPNCMETRHGSPIPIAIIYFMLARYAGVNLYPLCFPGGFVPAYVEKDKALFYVDVFRTGNIFMENSLMNFFDTQGISVEDNVFEVREDRVLLIIYLESLLFIYSMKKDHVHTQLLGRALELFGDERFLVRGEEE